MHKFQFGVQLKEASSPKLFRDSLCRMEHLGYTSVTIRDHLENQLSPFAALGFATSVTSKLRLGTLVLSNDFRHPVMMAREAGTVSLLSQGRLDLGMGAGWCAGDYDTLGQQMDTPAIRIRRLAEAIQIIEEMFQNRPVSFEGEFYRVSEARLGVQLMPAERPRLVVGGGGKKVLELGCRFADVVGINPRLTTGEFSPEVVKDLTEESYQKKVDMCRGYLETYQRDPQLQCRAAFVHVGPDFRRVVESTAAALGVDSQLAYSMPPVLVGEPGSIADTLRSRRERYGLSNWVIPEESAESFAPVVEQLAGT